ncbi:protein flp-like [Octopus sinensis]|uniref:Protein flp-like n=1 Tax=Octopus sinensis TaxID=2607531 RepID=A0A6P7TXP1_9MOLL|nr:protein flp-like [Octopus sinensis]
MLTFRELFVFCCFCVIIFSDSIQCRAAEQRYSQNETHEKISVFANTLLRVKNLVAGAVVVVKNDEVVYRQGFGRRNLSSEAKVDNNTLFGIASLTKAFGAATLVKVIEEMKNVSLKTPISDYLDDIEFSTEQRTKYANIEDLLAHRMGLPRNNFLRLNQNFNRQTIPKFLKYFEEIADFRGSYVYSNIMYGLATLITEKLANNTWEDVVTEKILRPLGMNATKFSTRSSGDAENIARSYVEQEKKRLVQVPFSFKRKWADIGASGSIQTTANDISKWMRFLLNGNTSLLCNIFKVRNFAIQTKNRFHRPEMPVEYSNSQYALGWNKGHYRGYPIIVHTGTSWGDASILLLFPEEKLAVFGVLTGSDTKHLKRILLAQYVADLYLGFEPWINATSIKDFVVPKHKSKCPRPAARRSTIGLFPRNFPECRKTITKPNNISILPSNFSSYDGIYNNILWGNITVTYNTESQGLFFTYGFATFQLLPRSRKHRSFAAKGIGEMCFMRLSSINFEYTRNKGITSMTIPSFERSMPPTFLKIS